MGGFQRISVLVSVLALLAGCSNAHQPEDSTYVGTGSITSPTYEFPAVEISGLEVCLDEGGELFVVDAVDNNDVADHGDLVAFAVSADRHLAAAGADGTVKLWTLEGFVGSVMTGELAYGVEVTRSLATDLAWMDDWIAAGDVQGLVSAWNMESGFLIIGGTTPDTAITAIAVDGSGKRVAHADASRGGAIMVRDRETGDQWGPLEVDLETVNDLGFLPDGSLLVAGQAGASPEIEVRSGVDFERTAMFVLHSGAPFSEIAVSGDGSTVAAVDSEQVYVLDASLALGSEMGVFGHDPTTVSLTETGLFALTGGADDLVRAFRTETGEPVAEVSAPEPVSVRADPLGELLFSASRDGAIRAIACR